MPPPTYFPLRWESTGDQWWYASPIDYAAANGHYDLVRELLRLDGNHLIKLTSLRRIRRLETVWDDEEQFHDVANCRSEVARKLLSECEIKKGKNSLIGAGYGGWLLYTAASAGDLGFVNELLEKDPLLVFGEGEYGVTDILYAASRGKDSEVFKVVLDFAVSPRFFNGENDAGGIPSAYKLEIMNRALHAAARGGNVKLLKEILSDCSDSVLAYRDRKGSTVLHAAAARGQVEVVKNLVSYTELINSIDNHGNTALHAAAHRGHLSVVEALILASPSLVEVTNNAGETFLHTVVTGFQTPGFQRMDRQIELMKHLLNGNLFNVGEIINAKNNQGKTTLHLAIIGNVHSNLVELLMTVRCIDVNARDTDGLTPLDVIRHKPCSSSSEILTRQLISAGGILTSWDYSARRVITSHIKQQSLGGSPGTSFRINDTEIFLYTGIENASSNAMIRPSGIRVFSPDPSQLHSNMESRSSEKIRKSVSMNYAAQRIKRLLHWPKMKTGTSDRITNLVEETSRSSSEEVPIPLRQRFSKLSSLTNNKRVLAVRSNQPSPMTKKKLASGLMHGAMQAIPTYRSRSSSFSKFSLSSRSSFDTQNGGQVENDTAKPSCSTDGSARNSILGHGSVNRRLMNQYLCFGGTRGQHIGSPTSGLEPHEVYEQSVLSTT